MGLGLYLSVSIVWLELFWITLFMKRQLLVFAFIGVVAVAIVEHFSVFHYHRWMYKDDMPTVFGIGISPLFQLSITGLLAVWLTRELHYEKGLFRT